MDFNKSFSKASELNKSIADLEISRIREIQKFYRRKRRNYVILVCAIFMLISIVISNLT